ESYTPAARPKEARKWEACMVNCQNCGSEVNGKFCTNCGTPLPDDTASTPDSGATTVIRAEDLQRMEAAGEQPQTPEPGSGEQPAPGWTQPSQEPSWSQPSPVQPSAPPDWTQGQQPGAGQQADNG